MTSATNTTRILIGSALALSVVCLFVSLFFGIDLIDEAAYLAIAKRFSQGDAPFRDEHNLIQGAALFTEPLMSLYLWWKGGSEGVVLFFRFFTFLVRLVLGIVLYRWLVRSISPLRAAAIVIFGVAFLPRNIPNFGYYLFAQYALLFAAVVLWEMEKLSLKRFFLAGVLGTVGAVGHPVYIPSVVLLGISSKWKRVLAYCLGALLCGLMIMFIHGISFQDVFSLAGFFFSSSYRASGLSPAMINHWKWEVAWSLGVSAFFSVLLLAALRYRPKDKRVWEIWLLFTFLVLLYISRPSRGGALSHTFVTQLGLLMPVIAYLTLEGRYRWRAFTLVFLPASAMGVLSSYLSMELWMVSSAGYLTAAFFALLFLAKRLPEDGLSDCLLSFPAILVSVLQLFFLYNEGAILGLTRSVEAGAYSGLRGRPEKVQFVKDAMADLKPYGSAENHVQFVPHFPAGYLLVEARASTGSIWDGCRHLKPLCKERFDRLFRMTDYIFYVPEVMRTADGMLVFEDFKRWLPDYQVEAIARLAPKEGKVIKVYSLREDTRTDER